MIMAKEKVNYQEMCDLYYATKPKIFVTSVRIME